MRVVGYVAATAIIRLMSCLGLTDPPADESTGSEDE